MDPTGRYTAQQRIKIIKVYFAAKSVLLTQRQCRRDFGRNNVPDRGTILCLVAKFRETGSVADAHKGHSGRHRSAIISENIQNLRECLEEINTPSLTWNWGGKKRSRYEHSYLPTRWTLPHCSDRSLEFLGRYFPGVDSFRVALTSLGHPTPLTWTHATTSFGGASRKGSMTTIPRPWQIWRTTSERRSGGYQLTW